MTARLHAVRIDAHDTHRVAAFWAAMLHWDVVSGPDDEVSVVPRDDTAYRVVIQPTQAPKVAQNRIHFDLTSASQDAMDASVARALEGGGQHLDIGQGPDEGHVVLADPEGNELCVIEPGNSFLAGTGAIGAINCDGSHAVGLFWSEALHWPLVWDQDEETAIQSPRGGSKITWSGPPLMPRHGRDRLRLDLVVDHDEDLDREVARLVDLGARRADTSDVGRTPSDTVALLDPDGNEFLLMTDS